MDKSQTTTQIPLVDILSIRPVDKSFRQRIKEHEPFRMGGLILSLTGVLAYLLLCHELLRTAPPALGISVMAIVPVLLWFVWKRTAKKYNWNIFLAIKTYSVTSASCFFLLSGYPDTLSNQTLGYIIYGFMFFNILEAVVFEYMLRKRDGVSQFNTIAGLLIAISTPIWDGAYIAQDGSTHNLLYENNALWIIAYTVWNLSFVYNLNKSRFAGLHSAVLLAPFIVFLVLGEEYWFQARFFTLALYLTTYNTFYGYFYLNMCTHQYHSDKLKHGLPLLSLLIAFPCAVSFIYTMI